MNDERLPRPAEYWAEIYKVHNLHLRQFALDAACVLGRGGTYLYCRGEGISNLELAADLRCSVGGFRQAADLYEAYGWVSAAELLHAAHFAMACLGLPLKTVGACLESEPTLLKTMAPSGKFARAVVEVRRLQADNRPPPRQSVAWRLAAFFGETIGDDNIATMAPSLSQAFWLGRISPQQAEDVLSCRVGEVVTPALALEIAEDAIREGWPSQATSTAEVGLSGSGAC